MIKNLAKITATVVFLISIISVAETTPSTKVPVKNQPETCRIFIAGAGETGIASDIKNPWLATTLNQYMKLRFTAVDKVEPFLAEIKTPGLSRNVNYLLPEASKIKPQYILLQTYSLDPKLKQFSYFVEVFSIKENRVIKDFDYTVPYTQIDSVMSEASYSVVEALGIAKETDNVVVKRSLLTPDIKLMEKFGTTLNKDNYGLELYKKLEKLSEKDQVFAVLYFTMAEIAESEQDYGAAATNYNHLLLRNGLYSERLYLKTAKFYRKDRRFSMASRLLSIAKKKGFDTFPIKAELARNLEASGKKDEADIIFADIIKEDPNQSDALLFYSNRYYDKKNYAGAINYLDKLIKMNKYSDKTHLLKAKSLIAQSKDSQALSELKLALKETPKNSEAISLSAGILFKQKKYSEAIELYRTILTSGKFTKGMLMNASEAFIESNNKKEALAVLSKYKNKFPSDPALNVKLGKLQFEFKDTTSALSNLRASALKLSPLDSKALIYLGDIYLSKNNTTKAIESYKKAEPLVKNKTSLAFTLGKLYFKSGNKALAEQKFKYVLLKKPKQKDANRFLGDISYEKKQFKTALQYYKKERSYYGTDKHLQSKIADIYFSLKAYTTAKSEYLKLVKINPTNTEAYSNLGLIALKQNSISEAEKYITKAKMSGKIDPSILLKLADGEYNLKKYSQAKINYFEYLNMKPNDQSVLKKVANIHIKTGADTLAADVYVKLYNIDKVKNHTYFAKAADIYFKHKHKDLAYKYYSELIATGRTSPTVSINKAKIDFERKNYTKVNSALSTLSAPYNTKINILEMLTKANYELKDYKKAAKYSALYIAKKSNSSEILKIAALSNERNGNIKKAVGYYTKYLVLKPNRDVAFHLAELYQKINFITKAVAQFKFNLTKYPKDARNYEKLADIYIAQKNYTAAIPILSLASLRKVITNKQLKLLADTYYKRKNIQKALTSYEKYIAAEPSDTAVLRKLGEITYNLKYYKRAVKYLSKAQIYSPNDPKLNKMLGMALYNSGSKSESVAYLEKRLALKPTDTKTATLLSKYYTSKNDLKNLKRILKLQLKVTPNDYSKNYKLANIYISEKNTAEAVKYLERSSKLKPSVVSIHKKLATIYLDSQNSKAALVHINKVLVSEPSNSKLLFEKVKILLKSGKYTAAQVPLKKIIKINPKKHEAAYLLAKTYIKNKNYKNAYKYFRLALKFSPNNPKYLYGAVFSGYKLNYISGIEKLVPKLLKTSPKENKVLLLSAKVYMAKNKLSKAKKVLLQSSNSWECTELLGKIYYLEKNYDNAYKELKKIVNKRESADYTSLFMGNILSLKNNFREALKYYESAYLKNPKNYEAVFNIVSIKISKGKLNEAWTIYSKSKNPNNPWSTLAFARLSEEKRNYASALNGYKMAMKTLKNNPEAQMGIGRVYIALKKYNDAVRVLSIAMVSRPEDINLYADLAEAYYKLGNQGAAIDLAKMVVEKNPKHPDANKIIGMAYVKKKKHTLAIEALEKATAIKNVNCKLLYPLAKEYFMVLQYENAIDAFERSLGCASRAQKIKTYKLMGDICYSRLQNKPAAEKYYKEYLKLGGTDSRIKKIVYP